MAIGATLHLFTINLSNTDTGIYESFELRVARHPSETADFLITRVMAWCLEYREGLAFAGGGVSDRDEPTLYAKDLTGSYTLWVELGVPSAERLHQASKACPNVAVYCHKDAVRLKKLEDATIHRAQSIKVMLMSPEFIQGLVTRLDRRMNLDVTVSGDHLYCSAEGINADMPLTVCSLDQVASLVLTD